MYISGKRKTLNTFNYIYEYQENISVYSKEKNLCSVQLKWDVWWKKKYSNGTRNNFKCVSSSKGQVFIAF